MTLYFTQFLFSLMLFGLLLIDGILLAQAIKERSLLGITIMVVLTAAYLLAIGWLILFSPLS